MKVKKNFEIKKRKNKKKRENFKKSSLEKCRKNSVQHLCRLVRQQNQNYSIPKSSDEQDTSAPT